MKLFVAIVGILILMSVAAWKMQPVEDSGGRATLTWVSDDNPSRREQIKLFENMNSDCRLHLDPNNGGTEKVIVQSLAGVGPDIYDCFGMHELAAYVKSGVVWDVSDELVKAGVDIKKTWPIGSGAVTYKGRVYGLPTNVVVEALWFNKDIFDCYGIPYPKGSWTWKEFLPVAQKLTVRDNNGRVKQYGLLLQWAFWPQFVWQWGGSIYSKDGTHCTIDSPQAIAGVQFLHDLIYKYKVMPTPNEEQNMATTGGWGAGSISLFGAGKAAMAYGGRWWLCTLRGYKGLRLGAVECPYELKRIYFGGSRVTLINKHSPRRKQALEFLKFLSSKNYNELINNQADGIAPVVEYSYTDKYLHDPEYPQEDCNAVWRDTVKYARLNEVSQFINALVADRILSKQMDLVKNNQKPVAEALKEAARQINAEIQKNIEQDQVLKSEYEKLQRNNR